MVDGREEDTDEFFHVTRLALDGYESVTPLESIERAIVGESARWGDAKNPTPYTRDSWVSAMNTVMGFITIRTGVFVGQLQADWHRPVELNSDHDAVVAGLSWTTEAPAPAPTVVRNQPDGTTEERTAVSRALRAHLASTSAGDTVQVATRGLDLPLADRALRRAEARGVRVQVTTLSLRLTWRERRLRRTLDTNRSWLRRCQDACRAQWLQEQPPSLLLVTGADGDGKVRIDVSRPLRRAVVTRRTTARITTSRSEMSEARAAFAGL